MSRYPPCWFHTLQCLPNSMCPVTTFVYLPSPLHYSPLTIIILRGKGRWSCSRATRVTSQNTCNNLYFFRLLNSKQKHYFLVKSKNKFYWQISCSCQAPPEVVQSPNLSHHSTHFQAFLGCQTASKFHSKFRRSPLISPPPLHYKVWVLLF